MPTPDASLTTSNESPETDGPGVSVLFFDGVCGFCNRCVDFTLRRDRRGRIRVAPLQGETAAARLPEDARDLNSLAFLTGGRCYRYSAAVVRVLWTLGGLWAALGWLLWIIPQPLRDVGYRCIARHRYRIFGKKDSCRMPTAEERARFLP